MCVCASFPAARQVLYIYIYIYASGAGTTGEAEVANLNTQHLHAVLGSHTARLFSLVPILPSLSQLVREGGRED